MKSIDDIRQQQPPQQQPPQPEQAMGQEETVTPEEQEAYERVVLAGTEAIFSEETLPHIKKMLEGAKDDPPLALAEAATQVMLQIDERGDIPEDLILPASAEVLEQLGELANKENIFPVDQKVLDKATQVMLVRLAESYGIEPEDIEALVNSVDPAQAEQYRSQQEAAWT